MKTLNVSASRHVLCDLLPATAFVGLNDVTELRILLVCVTFGQFFDCLNQEKEETNFLWCPVSLGLAGLLGFLGGSVEGKQKRERGCQSTFKQCLFDGDWWYNAR